MITIRCLLITALCAFSTLALADCKSDFFAANQACVANNPNNPDGTVSAGRIACDSAAVNAYNACVAAQAPAVKAAPKKKT